MPYLQDLSIGLLGLGYLAITNPEPDEAVIMMRVAGLTSVIDMAINAVPSVNVSRAYNKSMVRSICSVVRKWLAN